MVEHERSFIFTHESGREFIDKQGAVDQHTLEDYYLNKDLRVWSKDGKCIVTRKTGDKAKGFRMEDESEISHAAARLLCPESSLTVRKTRFELDSSDKRYMVTMDMVEEPMKLAILEVEAKEEIAYPVPKNISEILFGEKLQSCPLSAHWWSIKRQKRDREDLSHRLNTEFVANSFHVVEFATSFIQKYHKNPTFIDQFFVWFGQHEREDNADSANVVVSDCPTFLSYVYMLQMQKLDFCTESALYLSKMYKRVLFDLFSYTDLIFMPIVDYRDNRIRFHSKKEALEIECRVKQFLSDHNVPHRVKSFGDEILADLFYINR